MRAGGAGTAGSISVRGKRTATPISARCADASDRVGYALDASPSRPLSSTPPKSSRRRSRPSVLGDAPHCQRAATPVRGVICRCASARVVVPTTRGRTGHVRRRPARASPLPLLNGSDRGGSAAASTHRCEPTGPLPGRSAGDQATPAPEGRLVGVRAGGAGSVGSISIRRKRTVAPMSAGYGCGSSCGGAVGDHTSSLPSVLRFPTARRRYRSSPPCILGSPHYLLPPSLALRDTSRVLSFPVLLAKKDHRLPKYPAWRRRFSEKLDRASSPGWSATSKARPTVPATPGEDTDGEDPAKNLGLHRPHAPPSTAPPEIHGRALQR